MPCAWATGGIVTRPTHWPHFRNLRDQNREAGRTGLLLPCAAHRARTVLKPTKCSQGCVCDLSDSSTATQCPASLRTYT